MYSDGSMGNAKRLTNGAAEYFNDRDEKEVKNEESRNGEHQKASDCVGRRSRFLSGRNRSRGGRHGKAGDGIQRNNGSERAGDGISDFTGSI